MSGDITERLTDGHEPGRELLRFDGIQVVTIEDDPISLRLYNELLRRSGCTTHPYSSRDRALIDLEKAEVDPDLILADLYMDGMSMERFVQRVRAIPCYAPIVVVSGIGTEEFKERFRQAHNIHFLRKPFSQHDLISRLQLALPQAQTELPRNPQ